MATTKEGLDLRAAATRSMLGWGVLAGPFYLVFGLILALTRPGFDLTRDALSLLLLGDLGWLQAVNLVLAGLMTLVAALGLARTPAAPRAVAVLVGVYGLCLVLSAVFPPDATPAIAEATALAGSGGGAAAAAGTFTTSGVLHLAFGGIGFLSLGVAALLAGGWLRRAVSARAAVWSRLAGILVLVGFAGGAALAQGPAGVALLWLAVLAGWAWLALTSLAAYRTVPHPVLARRPASPGSAA